MSEATIEKVEIGVKPRLADQRRTERIFWSGLCWAIAAVVFAGFSRTYFLSHYFNGPPISLLVHAHGLVFTSWIVLLLVQTTLVASNHTKIHRKLGMVAIGLVVLMVVLGTLAAIKMAALGRSPPGGPPPLVFLTIPFFEMVTFPTLIAAGFYYRKRTDYHKRLIVIATIAISSAAVARLPLSIMRFGPPAFFGLTDAFMIPIVIYDFATRGKIHPATLWAGLFVIGSQILRLIVGGTATWDTFARWLTSFAT
jgi:hypothetical protein